MGRRSTLTDRTCEHCGGTFRARRSKPRRSAHCEGQRKRDYMREYMRNRYRDTVGIPHDAPLHARAA